MKNRFIGIMADQSPGLVTGLMGILKSGNCFVPINPNFPNDRVRFILNDCHIDILLTDKINYEKARQIVAEASSVRHLLCIDDIAGIRGHVKEENETSKVNPANPAYVIYTSGSTGRPKGVPITHGNLTPLFYYSGEFLQLGAHTRVMQNLSYTFDFGVFEILTTLLFGGRLYVLNKSTAGGFPGYVNFINRHCINTLHTTPVFLNGLVDEGKEMPSIKLLHLGGEPLTGKVVRKTSKVISAGCLLFNGYGPTEASINCTFFSLTREEMAATAGENIPIGGPCDWHEIYILDRYFNLQPIGGAGELCIAGPGLSRGYLNRPELTAEKFINKSFAGVQGGLFQKPPLVYHTGDLARWLPDGNIEFLGRIDQQVKVRGFRIELGEIESSLSLFPAIKETVVLAWEHKDGGNYLCAYIVTQATEHPTVSQLREFLLKRLPDYMIPTYFIHLERIPLSPNGKIDRKALPKPGETLIDTGSDYIAPGTDLEKKLVSIWQDLLAVKGIGGMDDFFRLGGDSILVNRCIARIREDLQAEIPLRKFFQRPFIKALAEEIENQERRVSAIKPMERVGEIPLSFAQERLWFLQELDTGNVAYFVPRVIRMKGKLDVPVIERTFTGIVRRHEILRTTFPTVDGRPVQRVQPPYEFKIPVLDWSRFEEGDQEQKVTGFLSEEDRRPFDFEKGPLLRVTLLKLKDEEHLFVLTEHHLVHDGWTQGVLLREFIAIFTAFSEGKEHRLPGLPIQYADYAIWQRNRLRGDVLGRHLAYWGEKLSGLAPVLDLPADRPRPPVISGFGALEEFRLPGSFTRSLKEFSRENGATLFMTMLAVFKILLYRYTGVVDLCVGTGLANRRYKEMEGMLGMVINTLPLRTQAAGEISFKECLSRVKETCLEAYQHEDTPFGKIVEVMRPERSLGYSPLFQVMFSFMDTPGGELRLPGLELELLPAHNRSAKFDINVVVVPPPEQDTGETGEILVEWEYNTDIFDASTIKRMVSHYKRLLEGGLGRPETTISTLPLLWDVEMEQVLYEFNRTEMVYPREKTIHQLFAEQAARTPDRIALVGADEGEEKKRRREEGKNGGVETLRATSHQIQITYLQLNVQSNCLGGLLIEKGVLPGDIVAIMMERTIDLIIGILGILEAGAAYLPIDMDYPRERIAYMLKDSNTKVLIIDGSGIRNPKLETNPNKTNSNEQNKNRDPGAAFVLNLENLNFNSLVGCPRRGLSNFVRRASNLFSSNLAYIIYTSGSTGIPKGTFTLHANVIRVVRNTNYIELTEKDRILQLSNYAFDGSVFDIYGALLNGAVLVLVDRETAPAVDRLAAAIRREQVTVFFVTTALFNTLVDLELACLKDIRKVLFGGERVSVGHSRKALAALGEGKIIHVYGPTETTVYATYYFIDQIAEGAVTVPIGKPIANTTVYIVDKYFNPVPLGIPGEIYIGGDGVARGYLNNPEMTAEKFINKSFAGVKGGLFQKPPLVAYQTGDLARWLADGNIEFLGRVDRQVKIRGFRIELGEIEGHLLKHGQVKEAVVIDRRDRGEKYLCAYIVSHSNPGPGVAELKTYLAGSLPVYMVPSFFIVIDKFPLNRNGKIDLKALPEPGVGEAITGYTAPRDEVERKMVEIWGEVLKPPASIGIDDNFFDLGGHSLNATLLIAGMHKAFNVKVPLKEFFQRGCIREIAQYIKEAVKEEFIFIEPVEEKEYYALSAAQKRMYILQQMDEGSIAYNIPAVMRLEGVLDKDHLEKVFLKLIRRHESLRTSFIEINEEPVQRIRDNVEFEIETKVLGSPETLFQKGFWPPEAIIKSFLRPFDLSKAPLMRVGLVKEEEEKYLLMVDMHHIITDGTSMELFVKDFMALYAGRELLPPALQYKDYSGWQGSAQKKRGLKVQEGYWLGEFSERPPVLDLPLDYPRPAVQGFEGRGYSFEISPGETAALKALASGEGTTLYMVLLTLYYIFLTRLTGQEDIVVGTPVAGRSHAGLESIMGMFVNTLALRNQPVREKNFCEFLQEVNEHTLAAFANRDYPYEELVEKVVVTRDPGRNPLFDTLLNLRNLDISEIEIPGLKMTSFPFEENISKFDLTLRVYDVPGNFRFTFEYCTRLFKGETIERFAVYFKNVIRGVIGNKTAGIFELEIIPEEEKGRLLYDFNDTGAEYPHDKTIHQLFEEQVETAADRIAVIGSPASTVSTVETLRATSLQIQITYRQLDVQSDRLAGLLIEKGVLAGDIVAIMMERSIDLVTGILGILKSGGAYLPIEPDYPRERIDYMLKDSRVRILINKSEIRNSKFETNPNDKNSNDQNQNENRHLGTAFVLNLDHLNFNFLIGCPGRGLSNFGFRISNFNFSNLAYIMYTSGSTGKPKGVVVTHRNVIRLVKNTNFVPLDEQTRILQTTVPVFDVSTFEIWGSLLNGGQLMLVEKEVILDAHRLGEAVKSHYINTLWLSAPLFNRLMQQDIDMFSTLRYLLVGGDVLSPEHINRVRNNFPCLKIINGYGPTENATFSTTYLIEEKFEHNIPIGKPIANSTAYIYDKNKRLLPIGIVGELYVGGDGVALGYLNNPELTAERFSRNYKTGDLARWLPDGNIEFLGRIDRQVKIRGFRIELGEIEGRLLKHGRVKEAVVIDRQDRGEKYLCAYIVPFSRPAPDAAELRMYLSGILPGYMVPSFFVVVERMPLNASGKIDRKVLPDPQTGMADKAKRYTAPRNEVERKLAAIWREVLNINPGDMDIGIDDNFFQLGGHSLKAMLLASKIHKTLDVKIPLGEFFQRGCIREIAGYLKGAVKEEFTIIEAAEKKEYYELSSAQMRLYILNRLDHQSTAYNIPYVFQLEGILDSDRLEETFLKLIDRHESLRTSFDAIGDMAVQRIHENVEFEIEGPGFSGGVPPWSPFIRPFDLSKAPLLRVGLVKEAGEKYLLMVDMHHIIADGASMGVLVNDFTALYKGEDLIELGVQYKDFTEWQNRDKEGGALSAQEEYWKNEFSGDIPALHLPMDFARQAVQSYEGDRLKFGLAGETGTALKTLAIKTGTTLYMLLLAICNIFLAKLSNREEIVIGTPVAGRGHADLEKIIGMFVNTLALRNHPLGEKAFTAFLEEVKEKTLQAFETQDYPYEDLVKQVVLRRDFSRNPLFDVMFALENRGPLALELPGLKMTPLQPEIKIAKFDLTLTAVDVAGEDALYFDLEYCTHLFKKETAERFSRYFKQLVSSIIENPDREIFKLAILPEEEQRILLYDFNNTDVYYDFGGRVTVDRLLDRAVEKFPDHISVVAAGSGGSARPAGVQVTYKELNARAEALAAHLVSLGVEAEDIVGTMLGNSVANLVANMGIWKAAGAFLPIDADYPQERIAYMLKDSNAKILINEKFFRGFRGAILQKSPPGRRRHFHHSSHIAYILYTSGSTGKPKGAIIRHSSLVNRIYWVQERYRYNTDDVFLHQAAVTFDASISEMFNGLLGGVRILIPALGVREDMEQLITVMELHKISVCDFVPSYLHIFLDHVADQRARVLPRIPALRLMVSGGEVLTPGLVTLFAELFQRETYPVVKLVNSYGPTEATVDVVFYQCTGEDGKLERIPIGAPMVGTRVYIVDRYYGLQPLGVPGELCIGGLSVGLGYLNNPELTNQKFLEVSEPFFKKVLTRRGQRLYRTGDLARWLNDGNIEFLGRIDHQVKIRGFRIELGEIEGRLLKCHDIQEAVVIDGENREGKKYLCAYFVSGKKIELSQLRDNLAASLPGYMIPSYFIQVERIPLTSIGKIDRRALACHDIETKTKKEYAAPQNEIEHIIGRIWAEVLRLEQIDIDENFFDLGGDSIDIIRINTKIKKEFAEEDTVIQLLRYPTVRSFARYLNRGKDEKTSNNGFIRPVPMDKIRKARLQQKNKRI